MSSLPINVLTECESSGPFMISITRKKNCPTQQPSGTLPYMPSYQPSELTIYVTIENTDKVTTVELSTVKYPFPPYPHVSNFPSFIPSHKI